MIHFLRSSSSLACEPIAVSFREHLRLVSPPRMVLGVKLLQSLQRDMSVDLCGGDVRMAQQQLHHAQISAVVDEMGGKGVPQRMR
jgi:hypothetical protein